MRRAAFAALALAVPVLFALPAAAEFGTYGADGWPVNVNGESTNPFAGVAADDFDANDGDPLNRVGDITIYPYWPILLLEVQRLAADHPNLVKLTTIGKSTLGLDLFMLEIADWDNVEAGKGIPLDDREVVWVDGGTHSNEYSGVYFALAWAQFLVEQYATNDTAKWIVENRHTWIMPMVNPDGSNLMGRLNAHLVNINRNYPVIWDGEGHDELMNNRGPTPASEIETRINIEWFNKTKPDYYASVHCCGNLWLYPYGQEGVDPVDQVMLQKVCDEAFPEVRDDCGPIWSTIYPASGSSVDTAYEYTGTVAFGYEMSGRGAVAIWGQPLTFEDVMTQEFESWQGLLHAFLNVHRYGAHLVVDDVAYDGSGMTVTVRNDGLGELRAGELQLMFPSSGSSAATIPALAPGASAEVHVDCTQDGLHALNVSWQKRIQPTANVGHAAVPLLLTKDADSAAPDGGFKVLRNESFVQEAPGLGMVVVFLFVALALVVRRR